MNRAMRLAAVVLACLVVPPSAFAAGSGDLAPGTLDASTNPPIWTPQGDGVVSLVDAVALVRTSLGEQVLPTGETDCPERAPALGDLAPGLAGSGYWLEMGDGALDDADIDAIVDEALGRTIPVEDELAVGASLVAFACPVFVSATGSEGIARIDMVRSGDLSQQSCIHYETADGTAVAGNDYESASGELCFEAGETTAGFDVVVTPAGGDSGLTVLLRATPDADTDEPLILAALVIETIKPVARIRPTRIRLGMPENCPQTFEIANVGPQGSVLNFTVNDNGALGGFLDVQVGTSALSAGNAATVTVKVKPEFVGSVTGSTLVLNVHTPGASNYLKFPVSVRVRDNSPLGTWAGTWTGHGEGPNSQETPVGGTWSLVLTGFDLQTGAAEGTLNWAGFDVYWSQSQQAWVTFPSTARTIPFGPSNATIAFFTTPQRPCGVYQLNIANNAFNPSPAFYGPAFGVQLDAASGTVPDGPWGGSCECGPSGNFETHPYDPNTNAHGRSVGRVQGGRV